MQDAIAGNLGATVELQPFEKERRCPAGIESVSTANVIARLPGSIPGTGTFVVCAHVDATGSNDAGWIEEARNQCVPPSQTPGGEDNASGVAAVLEALRCIAEGMRAGQIDFAFDLEFIAFSGEEAEGNDSQPDGLNRFLTGSQLYVRERVKEVDSQGPILGALNLDMIGSEQLGNNLQLVHNPASEWMAQLVVEAAGFVDPPLDLTLVPQLDEALASDHNSFWTVNAAGILAADAPVDTLRSYATYHRPIDTGFDRDVRAAKMREVTRAVVATLLRFDTNVHSDPALFVPVESFRTFTKPPDGQETNYDHRFRRLFPEDPVESRLHLYNLGAEYVGPVRLSVRKHREDGTTIVLTEDTRQRTIPTGGQVLFVEPIPIFESDAGVNRITAEVAWSGPGGVEVRTNVVDTLVVRGHQPEFAAFSPNPVRDLQEATLLLQLRTPGTVTIRLYNQSGRGRGLRRHAVARSGRSAGYLARRVWECDVREPGVQQCTKPRSGQRSVFRARGVSWG